VVEVVATDRRKQMASKLIKTVVFEYDSISTVKTALDHLRSEYAKNRDEAPESVAPYWVKRVAEIDATIEEFDSVPMTLVDVVGSVQS
jgi:hypothetical protein